MNNRWRKPRPRGGKMRNPGDEVDVEGLPKLGVAIFRLGCWENHKKACK